MRELKLDEKALQIQTWSNLQLGEVVETVAPPIANFEDLLTETDRVDAISTGQEMLDDTDNTLISTLSTIEEQPELGYQVKKIWAHKDSRGLFSRIGVV